MHDNAFYGSTYFFAFIFYLFWNVLFACIILMVESPTLPIQCVFYPLYFFHFFIIHLAESVLSSLIVSYVLDKKYLIIILILFSLRLTQSPYQRLSSTARDCK